MSDRHQMYDRHARTRVKASSAGSYGNKTLRTSGPIGPDGKKYTLLVQRYGGSPLTGVFNVGVLAKRNLTNGVIGEATFVIRGRVATPSFVDVKKEWRRLGVATEMYKAVTSLGYHIGRADDQTEEGKKFRQGLKRKTGLAVDDAGEVS